MLHNLTKMYRYVGSAVIGFAACYLIRCLLHQIECCVPWEEQQPIMGLCFDMSGAYLASCSVNLSDLFSGRDDCDSLPTRYLHVSLLGASLGLFLLIWTAILTPNGPPHPVQLYHHDFWFSDDSACVLARDLFTKAQMLTACKVFLDNWFEYAFAFAKLAILNYWIYIKLNSERSTAIEDLSVLPHLMPSLIVARLVFLYVRPH
jgi:hypothetical protein